MMALVIAMVMMVAMGTTAMAATITVTQSPTGGTAGDESYVAYKIFDVTKTATNATWTQNDDNTGAGEDTGFAYTIDADSPWLTAVRATGAYTLTLSADETVYNVTLNDGFNTEAKAIEVAKSLLAAAPASAEKVEFTSSETPVEVDDGYYLITSSLGTNLILATSTVNLTTKNQYITDNKTVEETNYNIGDQVKYTITVNIPSTVDFDKDVIVHDTLDDVLAYNAATTGDYAMTYTVDGASNGTVHDSVTVTKQAPSEEDEEDQCTFEYKLDISALAPTGTNAPAAHTIVITYYAELLDEAAADTDYHNKEYTTYSEYKTTEKDVTIQTYDFDLEKSFTGDTDNTSLSATFILVTDSEDEDTAIEFTSSGANYTKTDSASAGSGSTTITVTQGTTTNVKGLEAGTYYLIEKTTANGYNLLTTPIAVTIDEDGNATLGTTNDLLSQDDTDDTIVVENQSGSVLPSTGGIGTTIFYIVGAILVIGAGILLVTRRRMRAE